MSAWEAIGDGVVDSTTQQRQRYWSKWIQYARIFRVSPYLDHTTAIERNIIITAFAARVRSGFFGRGRQVTVGEVAKALAAISKTIELAGEVSPVYRAHNKYTLPVERLIEGYRRQDPPPVPQLALPVKVPRHILQTVGKAAKHQTTADLCVIAFYFLLRVGEYTHPRYITRGGKKKRTTRTVQFTVNCIGFFKDGKRIPRSAPLTELIQADQATMKITNQKNGRMGQTIHHHATNTIDCPVKALARRVHHILQHTTDGSHLLCDYFENNQCKSITSTQLRNTLRQAVKDLNLHEQGIDPDLIGVHSLRAGGAMALKLNGQEDTTIMKLGRWSSLTFLMYIHNQIAHLSSNISQAMSKDIPFVNIATVN